MMQTECQFKEVYIKDNALYSQHLSSAIGCRLKRELEARTSKQIEDKNEGAGGTTDRIGEL